jgi:uncharacterized protein
MRWGPLKGSLLMRGVLFAWFLVAASKTVSAAGSYTDVVSAVHREDYELAARLFYPLAEQGHAGVQSFLGVLYANGQGVPQIYEEAIQWFQRAVDQGDARAQSHLGLLYARGQGLPKDYRVAIQRYRRAAEQGDALAQFQLGVSHAIGQGVPQDYDKAVQWYRRAAEQGHARAQSNLGVLYANGQGLPMDLMRAYMWLTFAVEGSEGDDLEVAVKNQTTVASDMTAAQIKQAQEMAQCCLDTQFLQCE